MTQQILLVVHVLIAIGIIAFVLIQRGKGAEAGAAFGAGASGTVFGARGSASFLTRTTAILAAGFFATSLALAFFANQPRQGGSSDTLLQLQDTAPSIPDDVPPLADDDLPEAPSDEEGTP